MSRSPWWTGKRGEWLVAAQIVLIALVFFGPRTWAGLPEWAFPRTLTSTLSGGLLCALGGLLLMWGLFRLGRNLTPLPYPREEARLVENGPYRLVRHPMYGGGILIAFGWAIFVEGWLTVVYAILLLVFFDLKSRIEEKWLRERFIGYQAYQKRVRKLIPFIY